MNRVLQGIISHFFSDTPHKQQKYITVPQYDKWKKCTKEFVNLLRRMLLLPFFPLILEPRACF